MAHNEEDSNYKSSVGGNQHHILKPTNRMEFSATNPFKSDNVTQLKAIVTDEDIYRFLGKGFCFPRRPSLASSRPIMLSTTEALKPVLEHDVKQTGSSVSSTPPPKPPRTYLHTVHETESGPPPLPSRQPVANINKPPRPLPRSVFLHKHDKNAVAASSSSSEPMNPNKPPAIPQRPPTTGRP